MAQPAFDTLKFVKTLQQAGIPPQQAEAFSDAVRASHEAVDVATARDLNDGHKNLSAEIASVRKDLSAEITDLRKEMTWRFEQIDEKFIQIDKKFEQIDRRFDRLEIKFERLQWFIVAAALGLIFKEQIVRLMGA
jgi:DNA-binding transcriptional MerR regulator